MTTRATVTQAEVTRAVKGALAAGLKVSEVRIDGKTIRVLSETTESTEDTGTTPEPWG